ncbi:fidgetin-like protein 1 [Drosophila biarmipes]|uniref:fidgetin-like protein 1 n=1 Tax=Drosophila biarmipes TaxID=125945 RepID=UPI0007E8AD11|nr:fidgetin-like protein 1 [Drosophila biarmipes]
MTEPLWIKQFAACEATFQSAEASIAQKQNAWRRQLLLLCQQTRDSTLFAATKEHQEKLERHESTEQSIVERLKRCQETIKRSRRTKSELKQADYVFELPQNVYFDPECRTAYESCGKAEMTLRALQTPSSKTQTLVKPHQPVPLNSAPGSDSDRSFKKEHHIPPEDASQSGFGFRTAREQLVLDELKKNKQHSANESTASPCDMMNFRKKTLGGKRTVSSKFVSPLGSNDNSSSSNGSTNLPPNLAHLDPKMVEQILGESMHDFKHVAWEDIAGLESAKSTFLEAIIMPLRRPDLFTGVRSPPRGVLLFGPPGTGKTLIARSIASQAKAKFFSINPSSLTSKWVGEAEKLVKTLFAVAAAHQPAIIFIDEVDSLLSKRSGNENESTLRLKNEFLIHLDGAASNEEVRLLVIGATNRPQELDEAVRRRFVRRLYVPLPTKEARQKIIEKILRQVKHSLDATEINELAELTDGYSGADVDSLCRYASMAPLRLLTPDQMEVIETHQLPAVNIMDFKQALRDISKSVSAEDCQQFEAWNEVYGVRH